MTRILKPTKRDPGDHLPLLARDFYILFFLAQRERHGYGLVKDITSHSNGAVRLDPANLYRGINKLSASGLVEDGPRRSDSAGGRERRYYRITQLGRDVVSAEAARLRNLAKAAEAANLIAERDNLS
ncbi:MAG: PadR family transcriptional regulator [Acidobacteria bacterium]|nr:PadR family transcriptional regulator [Acidobacteriota bacterium]